MRRKAVWCVVALALCGGTAFAQHPCDILQNPTAYLLNPNEAVSVGFCHSGVDDQGRPVTDFEIILPDRRISIGVPNKVTAIANGEGLFLYESAPVPIALAGEVAVRAVNAFATSLPSTPVTVTFTTLPVPPTSSLRPPTGLRFWRN